MSDFSKMLIVRKGSLEMSKQQFRNCLKRSIGANKYYADLCWKDFQDSPMHYMASRTPLYQGKVLFDKCLKLGRIAEHALYQKTK